MLFVLAPLGFSGEAALKSSEFGSVFTQKIVIGNYSFSHRRVSFNTFLPLHAS